jgi:NAD+ diphosphatase
VFVPMLSPSEPASEPSLLIHVRGNRVVLIDDEPGETCIFLGSLSGRHVWAVDVDHLEDDGGSLDLFKLNGSVDETMWRVAGRAVQLVEWRRTHRYCGRCATPTEEAPGERALKCPSCGLMAFPRLAPAVIMLVERDDGRVLLARNAMFPMKMFSCLAGFVEPGETLEDAVRREILEEVAIEVGEVEYRGSQPWPFPHQLMIGFGARYVSGDIVVDGTEIAEADWFSRDELPNIPPAGMSIAGTLIQEWVRRGA